MEKRQNQQDKLKIVYKQEIYTSRKQIFNNYR